MTGTEEMAPFLVRAHLSSGLAHATPWGISLDGILAAELWADHKAAAWGRGEYVPALTPESRPAGPRAATGAVRARRRGLALVCDVLVPRGPGR